MLCVHWIFSARKISSQILDSPSCFALDSQCLLWFYFEPLSFSSDLWHPELSKLSLQNVSWVLIGNKLSNMMCSCVSSLAGRGSLGASRTNLSEEVAQLAQCEELVRDMMDKEDCWPFLCPVNRREVI